MAKENLLEPKIHRSRSEIGRIVRDMVNEHGTIIVTQSERDFDIEIYPDE